MLRMHTAHHVISLSLNLYHDKDDLTIERADVYLNVYVKSDNHEAHVTTISQVVTL